jgi:hypothetical protein
MNEPGGTPNVRRLDSFDLRLALIRPVTPLRTPRRPRPAAPAPQHVPLTSFAHAGELIEQSLTAARTALAAHDAHPAQAQVS